MSKSKISQLTDPKRVAEAAKDRSSREHAMLRGALGAIEKGGTTVPVDESTVAKATHYGRVLSGADDQKLGKKHYGEIAKLVETFLIGPQKVRKVSSMKPSELAENLRRIASAIDNSKNPSKELVLKEVKRLAAAVGQVSVLNKPVDIGPTELGPSCTVTLMACDFAGEKTARNVVGTIDCGGGKKAKVSIISTGRGGSNQTFDPPAAARMFDPDEFNSFRPIDAFSMAINKIAEQEGYHDFDILTVENGLITHGL